MKYIIFNWKSYLNLKETSSLSKLIASFPQSKKHKIIRIDCIAKKLEFIN